MGLFGKNRQQVEAERREMQRIEAELEAVRAEKELAQMREKEQQRQRDEEEKFEKNLPETVKVAREIRWILEEYSKCRDVAAKEKFWEVYVAEANARTGSFGFNKSMMILERLDDLDKNIFNEKLKPMLEHQKELKKLGYKG